MSAGNRLVGVLIVSLILLFLIDLVNHALATIIMYWVFVGLTAAVLIVIFLGGVYLIFTGGEK